MGFAFSASCWCSSCTVIYRISCDRGLKSTITAFNIFKKLKHYVSFGFSYRDSWPLSPRGVCWNTNWRTRKRPIEDGAQLWSNIGKKKKQQKQTEESCYSIFFPHWTVFVWTPPAVTARRPWPSQCHPCVWRERRRRKLDPSQCRLSLPSPEPCVQKQRCLNVH